MASIGMDTQVIFANLGELPFPVLVLSVIFLGTALITILKRGFDSLDKLIAKRNEEGSGEEARLIQDMFAKLNRLETRIESLETIIVETQRKAR